MPPFSQRRLFPHPGQLESLGVPSGPSGLQPLDPRHNHRVLGGLAEVKIALYRDTHPAQLWVFHLQDLGGRSPGGGIFELERFG